MPMTDLSIKTNHQDTTTISAADLQALAGRLRGGISLPDEDGYDEARSI